MLFLMIILAMVRVEMWDDSCESFLTIKTGQLTVMISPANSGHMWYCLALIGGYICGVLYIYRALFIVAVIGVKCTSPNVWSFKSWKQYYSSNMFKPADARGIVLFICSSCTLNFTIPLRLQCLLSIY